MGTKNNPGQYDCHAKAEDNEPLFTLLGRDKSAGTMVRLWALLRHRGVEAGTHPATDAAKVTEALNCADQMDRYCRFMGQQPYICEPLLMLVTEGLQEHPEGYDHPCACDLCKSYGAEALHPNPPGVMPAPSFAMER